MTIKEKLNKLIHAIVEQNDTQNEITNIAKEKGLPTLIENVNKEKMVLSTLTDLEYKAIAEYYSTLQKDFKETLTAAQLELYKEIEAYNILFTLNRNEK